MQVIGEGCIIDCDYLISVKDVMEVACLPFPRRRLRDCDGAYLPLIGVNIGRCQQIQKFKLVNVDVPGDQEQFIKYGCYCLVSIPGLVHNAVHE